MTKIISGCCLDHLPKMDSDSVDSIVTDPPYEIGIVGRNWDNAGVAYAPGVWIECLRVLKPGGHLVAFGGARTYHRLAVAVEDVGFEIRDCLSWLYGSGFPKSMNVGKALAEKEWEGWGTNLKPSQELIVLARKPLAEKTIALNVKKWGTGAINIDGCRIPYQGGEESNTVKRVEAARLERERKEWERPGLWNARDPTSTLGDAARIEIRDADRQGRFPANTLHDGSEEATEGFPTVKAEKRPDQLECEYRWNKMPQDEIRSGGKMTKNDKVPQSASRYFKQADFTEEELKELEGTPTTGIHSNPLFDADGNPRAGALGDSEEGVMGFGRGQNPPDPQGRFPANTLHDGSEEVEEGFPTVSYEPVALKSIPIEGEYARSNSMSGKFPRTKRPHEKTIPASASRYFYCAKASRSEREAGLEAEKGQRANSHPTVKPLALMRWLCRLITPKGGKVLDPFTGSGTTGIAAHLEGFDFVGIEQDENYARIAEKRIRHWKGELE